MEENDNIENRFRETFAGYEAEPPEEVWSNLKQHLHPEPRYQGFWSWVADLPKASPVFFRFSIGLTTVVVILFLAVVWFASGNRNNIRGHAYAGEQRLCRGTAYLFRVDDKARPYDSLKNIRTCDVDENGYYQFSRIGSGKYLIRISPQQNSEGQKRFLASWYDQLMNPDFAHLIQVDAEDLTIDVHLLPRP